MIKLLIADDSALMRKMLEGVFHNEGDFDIRLARNGLEALELVRSFEPHVVTLDVQMPGMDGLTCLGKIMLEVAASGGDDLGPDGSRRGGPPWKLDRALGAIDFVAKPTGTVSLEIDQSASAAGREDSRSGRCPHTADLAVAGTNSPAISRGRPAFAAPASSPETHRALPRRDRFCGRTGVDRNLDRRAGGPRYRASAIAGRVPMAGS